MKLLAFLTLVILASLLGGCNGQIPTDSLASLAKLPLHHLLKGWQNDFKEYTSNSTVLQVLDINHTLDRLFNFGESQLLNLLFGSLLPEVLALLKDPAIQLRGFLALVLERLQVLDPKNLVDQLTAFIRRAKPMLELGIKVLDHIQSGNLDVSMVLPSLGSGAQVVGAVADAAKAVGGGGKSFWPFK